MDNDPSNTYLNIAMSFIEFAKHAKSTQELSVSFLEIIRQFGFEGFACVSYCDFSNIPDNAVIIMEYPAEWMTHYIEQKYERFDKILTLNLSQPLPFSWGNKMITRNVTDQQQLIFNEAKSLGILFGFSVPIHAHGILPASVNLIGPNFDIDPAMQHTIHLMSIYLHAAAFRLSSHKENLTKSLVIATDREKECLQWVAEGKSDTIIADILGVSQSTVHFHIENIKRKYGVATRVQAVVRAYLENQIIPQ